MGATFALAVADAGLQAAWGRWRPLLDLRARALFAKAVMRQPYDRLIAPGMRDDLKKLHTARATVYASFPDLVEDYANALRQLLSLVTAVVLLGRLSAARATQAGPLART